MSELQHCNRRAWVPRGVATPRIDRERVCVKMREDLDMSSTIGQKRASCPQSMKKGKGWGRVTVGPMKENEWKRNALTPQARYTRRIRRSGRPLTLHSRTSPDSNDDEAAVASASA